MRLWWPNILLASLALAVSPARPASPPAQKAKAQAASAPAAVKDQMQKLWQANTQPPGDGQGSQRLRNAVEKLKAVELSSQSPSRELPKQVQDEPAAAPAQPASQPTTQVATQPSAETDAALLAKLKGIPASDVIDLAALADSLFAAGHLEAALSFYELALQRWSQDPGRDWLLFQIGNCRRQSDLPGAREVYKRLIEQYPDSPWRPVAASRDRVIEWIQTNKPREFLTELGNGEVPATQPAAVAKLGGNQLGQTGPRQR